MFKRISLLVLSITVSLFITACTTSSFNSQAFKKPPKLAVVSVMGTSSGLGLSDKDERKLLTSASQIIAREFKKSPRFKLVGHKYVARNKYYRAIKAKNDDGLLSMKTAKGYKKFDPEKEARKIKSMAKQLRLSGTIHVTVSFMKEESSFWLSGLLPVPVPVSGGTTSGKVIMHVSTVNLKNEVIWSDMVEVETKESSAKFMGISNLGKIRGQLIDATKEAAKQLVKNLHQKA